MLNQAEKWRLRAEEYRAVRDSMHNKGSRQAFENLAKSCDTLAETADGASRPPTPNECMERAQECVSFAHRFTTPMARQAVNRVADDWRAKAATETAARARPSSRSGAH